MSAVDDNDSGVSEDINLNDIDTESKFNKISKQADKAERDLERAEKARIKTEAEVQKSAELLKNLEEKQIHARTCLLYTSPSPRDGLLSRMPSSA